MERGYIWGPGDRGVDELLDEYSVNGKVMYPVMDAGGDLIATVEAPGTASTALAASKWTYDAYGRVLASTSYRSTPIQRVGHKGLFFDNLEGGAADPMLAVGATLVGHNRNRVLLPSLGRFAQSDPNATGQSVIRFEAYAGKSTFAEVEHFDLSEWMSDGPSSYAYCNNRSLKLQDPLGLSSELRDDAYEAFSLLSSANFDVPGPSTMMGAVLNELVTQYGQNLDWDVDWASDWSAGDDWHSRANSDWIKLAIGRALASTFEFGIGEYKVGLSDLVGTASSGGSKRGTIARAIHAVSEFSHRVVVNGKGANVFHNPNGGRKLVRFDLDAIKDFANVLPTNSKDEIRQANAQIGRTSTPKGYAWHHHWEVGKMQLVPEDLHARIGHVGRAAGNWPAPIPSP